MQSRDTQMGTAEVVPPRRQERTTKDPRPSLQVSTQASVDIPRGNTVENLPGISIDPVGDQITRSQRRNVVIQITHRSSGESSPESNREGVAGLAKPDEALPAAGEEGSHTHRSIPQDPEQNNPTPVPDGKKEANQRPHSRSESLHNAARRAEGDGDDERLPGYFPEVVWKEVTVEDQLEEDAGGDGQAGHFLREAEERLRQHDLRQRILDKLVGRLQGMIRSGTGPAGAVAAGSGEHAAAEGQLHSDEAEEEEEKQEEKEQDVDSQWVLQATREMLTELVHERLAAARREVRNSQAEASNSEIEQASPPTMPSGGHPTQVSLTPQLSIEDKEEQREPVPTPPASPPASPPPAPLIPQTPPRSPTPPQPKPQKIPSPQGTPQQSPSYVKIPVQPLLRALKRTILRGDQWVWVTRVVGVGEEDMGSEDARSVTSPETPSVVCHSSLDVTASSLAEAPDITSQCVSEGELLVSSGGEPGECPPAQHLPSLVCGASCISSSSLCQSCEREQRSDGEIEESEGMIEEEEEEEEGEVTEESREQDVQTSEEGRVHSHTQSPGLSVVVDESFSSGEAVVRSDAVGVAGVAGRDPAIIALQRRNEELMKRLGQFGSFSFLLKSSSLQQESSSSTASSPFSPS
ncbi:hypothetical protein O3P69_008824 [Scylla paramamosain]|uniref:Uncharacterized protein n=1 Tax=Scylla paramamosain TaxID=85552 RepID=A0AAW0TPC1_SCYPA